jgi:hypothetical protein
VVMTVRVRFAPSRHDIPAVIALLKKRLVEEDPLLGDVTIEPALSDERKPDEPGLAGDPQVG